jgi:hypothetical protein
MTAAVLLVVTMLVVAVSGDVLAGKVIAEEKKQNSAKGKNKDVAYCKGNNIMRPDGRFFAPCKEKRCVDVPEGAICVPVPPVCSVKEKKGMQTISKSKQPIMYIDVQTSFYRNLHIPRWNKENNRNNHGMVLFP